MSFPKYYVTYCVMDTDAGANPFGHASLIFSKQEREHGPVEAINSIGFYSQPSTTTQPVIKNLKKLLGFSIDLQDGHGVLVKELMRYINGAGLKGVSFPVSEQQFYASLDSYQESMKIEQEAIAELNAELSAKGIEPNGYTRYIAELEKAKAEQRAPRLKPFHVTMDTTIDGFDSSASYTCKERALDLLMEQQIISEEIKEQIISSKAEHAFPRFSSLSLTPLRLISTGTPEPHTSKKGIIYHNHVWEKNKLYWVSPITTPGESRTAAEQERLNIQGELLLDILEQINEVTLLLHEKIDAAKGGVESNEYLKSLKIQLQRVENLAFLFNNQHANKDANLVSQRLAIANKVINCAMMAIEPERINYTFIMRAYESIALKETLVGLLAIMISAAFIVVAAPVGISLCVFSTLATARQAYGFYQEEKKFHKDKADYDEVNATDLYTLAS